MKICELNALRPKKAGLFLQNPSKIHLPYHKKKLSKLMNLKKRKSWQLQISQHESHSLLKSM
jgi:hypothetical protein